MKTTKAHFKLFADEAKRCVSRWGLNDWDVSCYHMPLQDGRLAETRTQGRPAIAMVVLNTEWNDPISAEELRKTARHEVTHILLGRLTGMAHERFVQEEEVIACSEQTVNRLERLLP